MCNIQKNADKTTHLTKNDIDLFKLYEKTVN